MTKTKVLLNLFYVLFITSCGTINKQQSQYISAAPISSSELLVPPGLQAPEVKTDYVLVNVNKSILNGYQLDKIKDIQIVQGGSERWMVIKNKTVDQIYPIMISYLNNAGLAVKYNNQAIGLIQTDWVTKNNNIQQGFGIRGFFNWIGLGSMYTLPTQYMFRITLWQNENDTNIFVTNYEISEHFSRGSPPHYSSVEPSNYTTTKWVLFPPNPQIELDFLLNFMGFIGLDKSQIKNIESQTVNTIYESGILSSNPMSTLVGNQLIISDSLDRAWWRVGLALERVGLEITDKNRTDGIYFVYPLPNLTENPNSDLFDKLFKKDKTSTKNQIPDAKYIVTLSSVNTNEVKLTINLIENEQDKNFATDQKKYLRQLLLQLQ